MRLTEVDSQSEAGRVGRGTAVMDHRGPDAGRTRRHWFVPSALLILSAGFILSMAAGVGSAVGSRADHGPPPIALANPHIVVLKSNRVLHLFDGDTLVRSYPIDLGAVAIGSKEHQGDGRTPTGTFRVVSKNAESPYHRFLGIDYPDAAAVERGLARGLISEGEAAGIHSALASGQCPNWATALGGGIGIHGHRIGRDWTAGCVALSDEHVAELFSVLRIGDLVDILP